MTRRVGLPAESHHQNPAAAAMARPLLIDPRVILEVIPVMALFAALLLPVYFNGLKVPRWEGALLLVGYVAFIAWQVRVVLAVRTTH